jgi:hypothetical protein
LLSELDKKCAKTWMKKDADPDRYTDASTGKMTYSSNLAAAIPLAVTARTSLSPLDVPVFSFYL